MSESFERWRGVPENVKEKNSDIPWREIAAFRNRAAHSGQTLDLSLDVSIVWKVVTAELPVLIPKLKRVLESD